MKKKLLAWGDSPISTTGMGKVNHEVMIRLHETGDYDITFIGIHYHGEMYDKEKYPYLILPADPNKQDMLGRNTLLSSLSFSKWDILYTHQDILNINTITDYISELREKIGFKWIIYTPVDTDQLQLSDIKCIQKSDYCAVYSEFGKKVITKLDEETGNRVQAIHLGVDLDKFHPISKEERTKLRKSIFNIEDDTYLVVNVNANRSRKDLPRTIAAFKIFSDMHPKSMLYIHASKVDYGGDLELIAKRTGLEEDKIIYNPNLNPVAGIEETKMNDIYGCADLIMSTSMAEGFGLSCIEAFACKVPALFPHHTSLIELIGERRERGDFIPVLENRVFSRELGTYWFPVCHEGRAAKEMDEIYRRRNYRPWYKVDEAFEWVKGKTWDVTGRAFVDALKEI